MVAHRATKSSLHVYHIVKLLAKTVRIEVKFQSARWTDYFKNCRPEPKSVGPGMTQRDNTDYNCVNVCSRLRRSQGYLKHTVLFKFRMY